MAKKKRQACPSNDDPTLDPEDSDATRREDERGRTILAMVGKAIQAGTKIPLEWHPIKKIPIGDHKVHFSTYIGVVVRERVSINYAEWTELPSGLHDEVYDFISRGFYVLGNRKGWILKQAALRWKAFKTRLRRKRLYLDDGVTTRKKSPWKYPWILQPDWEKFVQTYISRDFKMLSEKNRDIAKKKTSKYRGGRLGYQYFEEEIEKEFAKQGVHVTQVPRHLTWIKAHSHMKGGILTFDSPIDEEVHEAIKKLEAQVQRGEIVAMGRDDILVRALNKGEHGSSVRAVGSGITNKEYFGFNKPTAPSQLHAEMNMVKSELAVMKNNYNLLTSIVMSCFTPEQLRQVAQLGGSSGQVSQFGGFNGYTSQFGVQPSSGVQVNGFGGHVGSLGGNGLSVGQLGNSVDLGFEGVPFTQLLTEGIGRQRSEGRQYTHYSLEARSREDSYIAHQAEPHHSTSSPVLQVHLQSSFSDPHHVPGPETDHINQPEITSLVHQNQQPDVIIDHTFPEGWSDCSLAIEGDDKKMQIVANGQVYVPSTTEVLANHGSPLPTGHRRVVIKEDIVPNALLPCPNDELVFVCQAKGSYTAWPIHLILPKEANIRSEKEVITPSPRSASSQGSTTHKYVITDKDCEKVTTSWLRVLKTQAAGMRKRGETISITALESVFLHENVMEVILNFEDLFDWCFQREIGVSHMNIFMKHLKERCQKEGVSGMYGFCDANILSPLTPTEDEEHCSDYLARIFGCNGGKNLNQLFFAPFNGGLNWMLAVISPWNGLVYWLDPAGSENEIREFAQNTINNVLVNV